VTPEPHPTSSIEGLLNVCGFEKGFLAIRELLKRNGFLIIHDEYRNHKRKTDFIERNNCRILASFKLDENVWWEDYYKCLEKRISSVRDEDVFELFKPDIKEIKLFKQDPSLFKSRYYIVKKS